MEFHVIDLPKLPPKLKEDCTGLELWAKFINAERKEEFDMLAEKNIYIDSAYRRLQVISQDDKKRMEYEARQKAIRDYNEGLLEAEERGEQRGEKRGIQIGEQRGEKRRNIENARGMKNEGIGHDIISRVTGLSPAEIDSL